MSTPLLSNFAKSVLINPIGMSDTELQIDPADAALFPVPGANEMFRVILWDGTSNAPEIVEVSENDGGLFTITRAVEGTVARVWLAETQVRLDITAGVFDYFLAAVTMLSGTSTTSLLISATTKALTTQADKLFSVGQWLLLVSDADPTENWMLGQVQAYNGTDLTIDIQRISGSGTFADWTIMVSAPPGQPGDDGDDGDPGIQGDPGIDGSPGTNGKTIRNGTGAPGAGLGVSGDFYIDTDAWLIYGPKVGSLWGAGQDIVGPTGAVGTTPGFQYIFSTNTSDSDPGAGQVKFNNGTFGSITKVFIDNDDANGVDQTDFLDRIDDSTNSGDKGLLIFQHTTDPSVFAAFQVTGAVVDDTGYREIPVTPISGAIPDNADDLVILFFPTGDAGSTFLALSDTPANYTSAAGKGVLVNAAADALEFKDVELLGLVATKRRITSSGPLVLADLGGIVEMNHASDRVVTIPTNASVAFPYDPKLSCVLVTRYGAGAVSIVGDTGVTLNGIAQGEIVIPNQYGGVFLYKTGENEWIGPNFEAE